MTDSERAVVTQDLMARLAQHRALGSAPAHEHAWLVAHGSLRTYEVGAVVTPKGEQAKQLLILFAGRGVIRMDRGAGSHKIFEWKAGDVGGVMPYSRGASPPNDVVVEEAAEVLTINKEFLGEMIRECPSVTATLVHAMVDRARAFTSNDLRDEKLIALGKLAAGLAHELNNPASAVVRSAKMLPEALSDAETAAKELAAAGLSVSQFASIDTARAMIALPGAAPVSTVARADREDTITEWLGDHDATQEFAIPLADTSVTLTVLDALAATVRGEALEASLRWLAATSLVRTLSSDIEIAATRIHDLVSAVKGFSYMDHAPTPEPVDIRRGIADALTMLGGKTRAKSVQLSVDLADDLPRAHGVGAELNQVWLNLIDNALDAVADGGHVTVTARGELDCVVVQIADDGPGIPSDIQGRIFDPFFTTKGVGKGTGLGLNIVRRLLQRHEGEIGVESVPGRTAFQIRLPAAK